MHGRFSDETCEIRLKNIQPCAIEVGKHIKVKGQITVSSYGTPYMLVDDVSDITEVNDKEVQTRLQMVQAKLTPTPNKLPMKRIKLESDVSK